MEGIKRQLLNEHLQLASCNDAAISAVAALAASRDLQLQNGIDENGVVPLNETSSSSTAGSDESSDQRSQCCMSSVVVMHRSAAAGHPQHQQHPFYVQNLAQNQPLRLSGKTTNASSAAAATMQQQQQHMIAQNQNQNQRQHQHNNHRYGSHQQISSNSSINSSSFNHNHNHHHHSHHPHHHHHPQSTMATSFTNRLAAMGLFTSATSRRSSASPPASALPSSCTCCCFTRKCFLYSFFLSILALFVFIIAVIIYLHMSINYDRANLIPLRGKLKVSTQGDNFNDALANKTSREFQAKQNQYEFVLRGALDRTLSMLKTYQNHLVKLEVYSFKSGSLWVYFKLFINKRSLQSDNALMKRMSPDELLEEQFLPRLTHQTLFSGFQQLMVVFSDSNGGDNSVSRRSTSRQNPQHQNQNQSQPPKNARVRQSSPQTPRSFDEQINRLMPIVEAIDLHSIQVLPEAEMLQQQQNPQSGNLRFLTTESPSTTLQTLETTSSGRQQQTTTNELAGDGSHGSVAEISVASKKFTLISNSTQHQNCTNALQKPQIDLTGTTETATNQKLTPSSSSPFPSSLASRPTQTPASTSSSQQPADFLLKMSRPRQSQQPASQTVVQSVSVSNSVSTTTTINANKPSPRQPQASQVASSAPRNAETSRNRQLTPISGKNITALFAPILNAASSSSATASMTTTDSNKKATVNEAVVSAMEPPYLKRDFGSSPTSTTTPATTTQRQKPTPNWLKLTNATTITSTSTTTMTPTTTLATSLAFPSSTTAVSTSQRPQKQTAASSQKPKFKQSTTTRQPSSVVLSRDLANTTTELAPETVSGGAISKNQTTTTTISGAVNKNKPKKKPNGAQRILATAITTNTSVAPNETTNQKQQATNQNRQKPKNQRAKEQAAVDKVMENFFNSSSATADVANNHQSKNSTKPTSSTSTSNNRTSTPQPKNSTTINNNSTNTNNSSGNRQSMAAGTEREKFNKTKQAFHYNADHMLPTMQTTIELSRSTTPNPVSGVVANLDVSGGSFDSTPAAILGRLSAAITTQPSISITTITSTAAANSKPPSFNNNSKWTGAARGQQHPAAFRQQPSSPSPPPQDAAERWRPILTSSSADSSRSRQPTLSPNDADDLTTTFMAANNNNSNQNSNQLFATHNSVVRHLPSTSSSLAGGDEGGSAGDSLMMPFDDLPPTVINHNVDPVHKRMQQVNSMYRHHHHHRQHQHESGGTDSPNNNNNNNNNDFESHRVSRMNQLVDQSSSSTRSATSLSSSSSSLAALDLPRIIAIDDLVVTGDKIELIPHHSTSDSSRPVEIAELPKTRGPFAFETLKSSSAPLFLSSSSSIDSGDVVLLPRAERSPPSNDPPLPSADHKLLVKKRLFFEDPAAPSSETETKVENFIVNIADGGSPIADRFGNRLATAATTTLPINSDETLSYKHTATDFSQQCQFHGCQTKRGEFVCLNKTQICDDFIDCQDESDELDCVSLLKHDSDTNKLSFSNGEGIVFLNRRGAVAPMCIDYFGDNFNSSSSYIRNKNTNSAHELDAIQLDIAQKQQELIRQINTIGQYACSLQSYSKLVSVKINLNSLVDGDNQLRRSNIYHRLSIASKNEAPRQSDKNSHGITHSSFKSGTPEHEVEVSTSSDCPSQRTVFVKCGAFDCGKDSFTVMDQNNAPSKRKEAVVMNDFPWMVKLFHKNEFVCFGYMINDLWILTSSQCVDNDHDASNFKLEISYDIVGSSTDINLLHSKRRSVKVILLNSKSIDRTNSSSLALARVENRVRLSPLNRPICLLTNTMDETSQRNETELYKNCFIASLNSFHKTNSSLSQFSTRVDIKPLNECLTTKDNDNSAKDLLCTSNTFKNTSSEVENSDSFLICSAAKSSLVRSPSWTIVGIQSNTSTSTSNTRLFTKVSTYLSWIVDSMNPSSTIGLGEESRASGSLGSVESQACNQFRCSSGECLSWSRICDGLYDCSSHDDEKDCHK